MQYLSPPPYTASAEVPAFEETKKSPLECDWEEIQTPSHSNATPDPSATAAKSLNATIPELSNKIQDLTSFFYDSAYKSTWTTVAKYQSQIDGIRYSLKAQAQNYKATVANAITEAENGQTIARKIVYLLGKVEKDTRRDVLEDLLESVQERVQLQIQNSTRVKLGFEGVRAGLLEIATRKVVFTREVKENVAKAAQDQLEWEDQQVGSVLLAMITVTTVVGPLYWAQLAREEGRKAKAAEQNVAAGNKALEVIDDLCKGLDAAIDAVGKHIDFWSEINVRCTNELEQLGSAEKLVKPDGRIKIAVIEEGIDTWLEVEKAYKEYAASSRLSKQILEC